MQVGCSLATGVRKSCVFQGKWVLLVVDLYLSPDVTNFPKLTSQLFSPLSMLLNLNERTEVYINTQHSG